MLAVRDIVDAVRLAAVWLLVVSVFFGPAGLGASSALAAGSSACEFSCPCDDEPHADSLGDGCAEDAGEHDDAAPSDDQCPDEQCPQDCPNCSCSSVVAMAMVSLTIPLGSPLSATDRTSAPANAPTGGAFSGVFRPPRSRI